MVEGVTNIPRGIPPAELSVVRRVHPEIWGEIVAHGRRDLALARRPFAWPLAQALPGLSRVLQVPIAQEKAQQSVTGRFVCRSVWLQPCIAYPAVSDDICSVLSATGSLTLQSVPLHATRTVNVRWADSSDAPEYRYAFSRSHTGYVPAQQANFSRLLRTCGPSLVHLDLSGCAVCEFYREAPVAERYFRTDMEEGNLPSAASYDWVKSGAADFARFTMDWAGLTQLRSLELKNIPETAHLLRLMASVAEERGTPWNLEVLDISGMKAQSLLLLNSSWRIRVLVADDLDEGELNDDTKQDLFDQIRARRYPRGLQHISLTTDCVTEGSAADAEINFRGALVNAYAAQGIGVRA